MVFSNNLFLGAASQGDGYAINQSIRFPSPTTGFLNRTPSSVCVDTSFSVVFTR